MRAPVRIGLLADTHIPEAGPDLPADLYAVFAACDRILHCGDLHAVEVLDRLGRLAPVMAARGNGDTFEPAAGRPGVPDDPRVADRHVLDVGGVRIGLTHDLERLEGCRDDEAIARLHEEFGGPVDIAVCGHTHVPMTWGLAGGPTVVNPGSPTMPYGYLRRVGTVGFIDIADGRFDVTVVELGSGDVQLKARSGVAAPCTRGPRPS
jgi:putative phosphoesterase